MSLSTCNFSIQENGCVIDLPLPLQSETEFPPAKSRNAPLHIVVPGIIVHSRNVINLLYGSERKKRHQKFFITARVDYSFLSTILFTHIWRIRAFVEQVSVHINS